MVPDRIEREIVIDAPVDVVWAVVTEPGQAGLVSFRAPRGGPEDAQRAYDAGVIIRDLGDTGWLRASCGWWTSEDDIERLVAALS